MRIIHVPARAAAVELRNSHRIGVVRWRYVVFWVRVVQVHWGWVGVMAGGADVEDHEVSVCN